MTLGSITTNYLIKSLSGLANNSDSIVPMATKDLISDVAIIDTYRKKGSKDDVKEKTIEEFGTSSLWLFGIPIFKKATDKLIYPLFGLDPNLDLRVIKDKNTLDMVKKSLETKEGVSWKEKEVFAGLKDKCKFLNKFRLPFTNKEMYKGMFYTKAITATVLSAIALSELIKYKQNSTEKRIEKEYYTNNASKILLSQNIKNNNKNSFYRNFTSKEKSKNINFKGLGGVSEFLINPIKNTMVLDGTIGLTRLKKARKGEKIEVAFRELFQISFIYFIAKPIQKMFEKIGNSMNLPIEADPQVIFSKGLKEELPKQKEKINKLLNSNNIIEDIFKLSPKDKLVDLLDKSGSIKAIKDKKGNITAISRFKHMNSDEIKETLKNLSSLSDNIKNIDGIKKFKILAVLGNVVIAILAMGKIQPHLNILLRKVLNKGDNRNPAIVAKEKEMAVKLQQA